MNIILEGPDAAGKSTLAQALRNATGMPIKASEGKPATWRLYLERLRKYEALDGMIIDRHPIYSQQVYGSLRDDPEIPDEHLDNLFNRPDDLFIYCRAINRGLTCHEAKPTDPLGHLEFIDKNYGGILARYDRLAAHNADIIYHEYRQMSRIVDMVKGVLHERG